MLKKLASKKTAYYVYTRIEQSLRKRRNPNPLKRTFLKTGNSFPLFQPLYRFSSLSLADPAI